MGPHGTTVGNVLDDEELIEQLSNSKIQSVRIEERIAEQQKAEVVLQEGRQLYRPVAAKSAPRALLHKPHRGECDGCIIVGCGVQRLRGEGAVLATLSLDRDAARVAELTRCTARNYGTRSVPCCLVAACSERFLDKFSSFCFECLFWPKIGPQGVF